MRADRSRLFVALALPQDVRAALVRWQRSALGALDGLRLVRAESLHVTLCFLGSQRVGEIDAIAAACAHPADRVSPAGLSVGQAFWLPRRRPRVVAVGVQDPQGELAELQRALASALRAGGWYEPEARPFLPHVTLARVREGKPVRARELEPAEPIPLLALRSRCTGPC